MTTVEVCIDNIESLITAQQAGANRIELCSSLSLGGLTPSSGLIKIALKQAQIPIFSMIRPREGDFLYSSSEIEIMLSEIYHAKQMGVQGVVLGVLTKQAQIDQGVLHSLMQEAKGLQVTFHRAIDCCDNAEQAIDNIMQAGCQRVLTSGLAINALDGSNVIKSMVKQSQGKLSIIAASGVNAVNVKQIIAETGVNEVHLSGKTLRDSYMENIIACGKSPEFLNINITDYKKIVAVREAINTTESINAQIN